MDELICDREFACRDGEGVKRIVSEWMRPKRDHGDWRCDWIIHGVGETPERGYSIGVDSTQALFLALKIVRMRIEDSVPQAYWLEDGAGLGLPGSDGKQNDADND